MQPKIEPRRNRGSRGGMATSAVEWQTPDWIGRCWIGLADAGVARPIPRTRCRALSTR